MPKSRRLREPKSRLSAEKLSTEAADGWSAPQGKKETAMAPKRIARIAFLISVAVLLFAFIASSGGHPAAAPRPQSTSSQPHCLSVGGMLMTNFGAIDQDTTMGVATGTLRGAVSGTLLGAPQQGTGNTVVFHIQHHWVTESGDMLFFEPATATTVPLSQTLFAIATYPVHLTGGTGRFAGATGDMDAMGEVDLVKGTVFRYSGQVCFAAPGQD
jgi:hypothetical protein